MSDDLIRDQLYRHAVAARGIGNEIAAKIVELLNEADPEITEKIAARYARIEADGFSRGPASTKRLNDLLKIIKEVNAKVYTRVADGLIDALTEVAQVEAEFAAKVARSAKILIDIDSVMPSTSFLKTLVTTTPLPFSEDGVTRLMPWLDAQEAGRLRRLEGALRLGILQGETTAQMVTRIAGGKGKPGILETSRRDAQTIARTANAAIQNEARLETFKQMSTITHVEWSSILDRRTSQRCQGLSGKVWPIDAPHPKPPVHPNCRSILIPRRDDKGSKHRPYGDWLKDRPLAEQEEVLGKARAKVFADNPNMDFSTFFKEDGGYKTLDELRKFDARLFG